MLVWILRILWGLTVANILVLTPNYGILCWHWLKHLIWIEYARVLFTFRGEDYGSKINCTWIIHVNEALKWPEWSFQQHWSLKSLKIPIYWSKWWNHSVGHIIPRCPEIAYQNDWQWAYNDMIGSCFYVFMPVNWETMKTLEIHLHVLVNCAFYILWKLIMVA